MMWRAESSEELALVVAAIEGLSEQLDAWQAASTQIGGMIVGVLLGLFGAWLIVSGVRS